MWVSEVMLQQTQVDRVIPFFERFLRRFPTLEALAGAKLDDVLAAWSGLGYYSRARNLHAAAKAVVARHGGDLPSTVEELLELPGFGRYTAGAVASIAFGLRAPLVDGNVARVLSRLFLVEGAPGDPAREALLWRLAGILVDGPRPGDFNQSVMELGATVCVPASPRCASCPVARWCGALVKGRTGELPPPRRPTRRKRLELVVGLAQKRGAVLLARRPDGGLFGGLWELPSAPLAADATTALRPLVGPRAVIGPKLLVLERTLTHKDLVLHLHAVTMPRRLPKVPGDYVEWGWVHRDDLMRVGMSSAMSAALELLSETL